MYQTIPAVVPVQTKALHQKLWYKKEVMVRFLFSKKVKLGGHKQFVIKFNINPRHFGKQIGK
jgi:hypothetical protein